VSVIVPIAQLQRRPPEAGRIRLGVKTERAMKSIETFRFTSPHRDAIERLAELYGGTAKPWSDPKVAGSQWEVVTETNRIEVLAQPGGCTTYYELWTGGGCARRCDGVICEVAGREEMEEVSCICVAKGAAECDPYTRLNVVLPNLDFYGVWRMQTKGWNAAKELPGMFDMVVALAQEGRMVRAYLNLEPRKAVRNGKTKNFVVPTIILAATPDELLAGGGLARPQLEAERPAALESGQVYPDPLDTISGPQGEDLDPAELMMAEFDAEIIDAEVVDPEQVERERLVEEHVRQIAEIHRLDPDAVVACLWEMTGGEYAKLQSFIEKSKTGKTLAFTTTGKLTWKASGST